MTLYQRIIQAIKEKPMTVKELVALLQAPRLSVQSAVRDLRRHGFISAFGEGKAFQYRPTAKGQNFTHIPQRPRRGKEKKPMTTVQFAMRTQPKSIFEWRPQA